jgi:tRNA pseudouridine38-40 synthase
VQVCLESALAQVAAQPVSTVCAGRTDAGVHACGQVVHFDVSVERPERAWVMGTNTALPSDVAVLWARPVTGEFHARFSARRRSYRYVIHERRMRSPLRRGRVTWSHRELDIGRMQRAASDLVGRHDFTSYRAAGCQAKSAVRTIHRLDVAREDGLVYLDVTADAFLQHMVRNLAGVLMAIGAGRAETGWAHEVLEARDRKRGGVTAAADGLYLVGVEYPVEHALPSLCPWRRLW